MKNIDLNNKQSLSALENLPVAVAIFDNKKVYYINKKTIEILRLPKNSKINLDKLSIFDFILPIYHSKIKTNNNKIIKGIQFPPFELKVKDAKGNIIDIEVKTTAVIFNGKMVAQTIFHIISGRVKENENFVESRVVLDLVGENKTDIIFKYDYFPEEKYTFMSESIKNVLGYSPKDFYNDKRFAAKIIHPLDRKKIPTNKKDYTKNKIKSNTSLVRYIKKNKSIAWIETYYSYIKDKKERIISQLGICRDVTKLKLKEEELNQKWSNYRELLNEAPIAFFIHKGFCLLCNNEAVKILGEKSPEKIIGKKLINYIIHEQRSKALSRLKLVLAGAEFGFMPYKITNTKGKIIDVELKSVPVKYEGESCVLTIMQDVSDKVIYAKEKLRAEIAEEHNKQLVEEIQQRKQAEEKLNTIFNTSTHIIWTINLNYEITSYNKNYEGQLKKYYKTGLDKKINLKKLYKQILEKDVYDLWMEKYREAFSGKYVIFETVKVINADESIYREVYFSPIKDQKGKVEGVVAISHNITERKINEKLAKEQTAKLAAIFESSTHLVWTVNRSFELTSFNKNYYETILKKYKVKVQLNQKVHKLLDKSIQKKYFEFWSTKYEEAFAGKKLKFEKHDMEGGKNDGYREVFLNPIYNENNEIVEISCMAHDITENKKNERQMLDQSSRLKAIFESGAQLMWTVNKHMAFTSFNNNFFKAIFDLYGVYPELNKDLNRPKKQFATNEFHHFWNGKYEEALTGKTVEFITERTSTSGKKIFRQMFLHPIYNQKNEVAEVSCMGIDITEKVLNEQKIISQAAKLSSIFDGSSHYIWTVDRNFNLTSFNKNYSELLTKVYGTEPKQGFALDRGKMLSDKNYINWLNQQYNEAFNGRTLNFEFSLNDTENNKVYLDVFLNPVYENGKIVEVSGVSHDVTEKKINESRITQSLKEKEVLLKEVHHRVKNNMQVISSILNLQSSYVKDEYALSLLKESQNRIKTMAYIHESLYQNKTFTSINFSEYVSTLTSNILQSYASSAQKVRLVLEVEKVILNLDTSIPAGLIINELVTNSIKHAFTGSKDGIILINLCAKNNTLSLEVADNGTGFPEEVDFKNTNSLGLQLVNTLVEQLNGIIELKENKYKGTSFIINFPM